ncbi:MAG: Hpt domain-containing protein [Desulfobacteraceae bacterium]|nr:Hpt domain-containing protein [Desulfobacteraceae bacterium]
MSDSHHSSAIVNIPNGLNRLMGDSVLYRQMLELFAGDLHHSIQKIRDAYSAGDATLLRYEAHSLKGAAANLSVEQLSEIAYDLEQHGKNRTLDMVGPGMDSLQAAAAELTNYIKTVDWPAITREP